MTVHDVIVVGAGAGGSAAASLLARQGADVLLLDKSAPSRDTVRCDGLMPQGVYWLDRLGCAPEVLAEARGCIKACDLYLDGRHLLTGRFPDDTAYPDFALLVLRCRFNEILQAHATGSGARFEGGTMVRGVEWEGDGVRVLADACGKAVEHRARIVIGADGPSSAVSRSIGNNLKNGVLGLSVRTTYAGVRCEAGIRVYFNRDLFPSYGWMFIDEHQSACVGVGCAVDPKFPPANNLGPALRQFIDTDLKTTLEGARRIGPFSGGIAPHFRPGAMVADGVVLIGDAACQADPLNRGGIHTAIESAFYAADACRRALDAGDFSRARLAHYEALWSAHSEADWRTSEIFMSLAKNPGLKDLALFLLQQVGTLGEADPRFGDFASGVFSGVISQSSWLNARALYQAAPKDHATWATLLRENSSSKSSTVAGAVNLLAKAAAAAARSGAGLARKPGASLDWALEVLTKTVTFADRRFSTPRISASSLEI
jgi:geranylgeranyl reductase family protein